MRPATPCVLTINAGSSSIRFAVYQSGKPPTRLLSGKLDRLGSPAATFAAKDAGSNPLPTNSTTTLIPWLTAQPVWPSITAVGHRIVHGWQHSAPERVTPKLLAELEAIIPYDPEHLPRELALIRAITKAAPKLPQVACFDTSFHHTMPAVAQAIALPRSYEHLGIQRYGFHGLSYSYLLEALKQLDPKASQGRVIFAHLGNGSSLAAVHRGRCLDTTMGFTPSSGLIMGTRIGDIDPGLVAFLLRTRHLTPTGFDQLLNEQSGLLGLSGLSSDVRDLEAAEATNPQAAHALDLYAYQVSKSIGALSSVLGGLDTLVFSAGIGEHSPIMRARIVKPLAFLGLRLDARRNRRHAPIISTPTSRVTIRVIPTNEELQIARATQRLLKQESHLS